MKKASGFTLIELLVVIAIIALLMSILMPSLTRVRKNAKTTICIMNLKTWGLMIQMYSDDNNGSMHGLHVGDTAWQTAYRDFYEDQPKIRCCPEAVKPGTDKQGNPTNAKNPYSAWGIFGPNEYYGFKQGDYGSYGENGWIQNGVEDNEYFGPGNYWKTPYVKGASEAPAFLGAVWMHTIIGGSYAAALENEYAPWDDSQTGGIGRVTVNRHNGYLGSSFLDFSARKVGIKELLKVKWHRRFDTNKWYEQQEDLGWPDWMANFKDY